MELEILKQLIKISGLSQKDFSLKTEISEPRLSEWLNNKRNPKLSTLIDIAKKLDLEINIKITKINI